jgi:hypothetical protein
LLFLVSTIYLEGGKMKIAIIREIPGCLSTIVQCCYQAYSIPQDYMVEILMENP